ncbi:MFS transporter [Sulfitobacter aestuarii]|uniref:MFS transporter n=1 Tax=Sulfitobacter aestuarii TaxID=2161676 RepID=A0ABW5U3B3_9RHOB
MNAGILLLGAAYVLSQFFRAFLAVLSEVLERDIGAGPELLAQASGLWFLSFALFQLPVGWALDTIGPRRTAAGLLMVGGAGGALLFGLATEPWHLSAAMLLIGIGCAPVLMASYYIFAREYPPVQFATLASLMVGIGTSGNLVASYPMALAAETIGWRAALLALSGLTALTAIGLWVLVRDPATPEGEAKGSLREMLAIRPLWLIFPLMGVGYAIVGAVRGLWIGPYLADVFGADTRAIGQATLAMGVAMIVGTLTYGPLDRALRSRKWLIVGGTTVTLLASATLIALPQSSLTLSILMLCVIGFFGATYPVIIAHGRSFLPPHLIGRGVTMLNLFSIGGVGLLQFGSARLHAAASGTDPVAPYVAIFGLFSVAILFGLVIYLFSRNAPE